MSNIADVRITIRVPSVYATALHNMLQDRAIEAAHEGCAVQYGGQQYFFDVQVDSWDVVGPEPREEEICIYADVRWSVTDTAFSDVCLWLLDAVPDIVSIKLEQWEPGCELCERMTWEACDRDILRVYRIINWPAIEDDDSDDYLERLETACWDSLDQDSQEDIYQFPIRVREGELPMYVESR